MICYHFDPVILRKGLVSSHIRVAIVSPLLQPLVC